MIETTAFAATTGSVPAGLSCTRTVRCSRTAQVKEGNHVDCVVIETIASTKNRRFTPGSCHAKPKTRTKSGPVLVVGLGRSTPITAMLSGPWDQTRQVVIRGVKHSGVIVAETEIQIQVFARLPRVHCIHCEGILKTWRFGLPSTFVALLIQPARKSARPSTFVSAIARSLRRSWLQAWQHNVELPPCFPDTRAPASR